MSTWHLICDVPPPTDDSKFLVGGWDTSDAFWEEGIQDFVWRKPPQWLQVISHDENPNGPYKTRGWQHRNGPLPVKPTHWCALNEPPPFTGRLITQGAVS